MGGSANNARFLELESQANELVDKLEQLKSETENYQTATGHLDAVSERINTVLDAMLTASKGIAETVAGLKEIGTAEILATQVSITSAVEGIGDSLETSSSRLADTLRATIERLDGRLDSIEMQVAKIEENTRRSLWLRLLLFN